MTSSTAGTAHHHDAYRESRFGNRREGSALPAFSVAPAFGVSVLADVVLMAGLPVSSSATVFVDAVLGALSWGWAMSAESVGSGRLVPGGVHGLENDLRRGLPGQQTLHAGAEGVVDAAIRPEQVGQRHVLGRVGQEIAESGEVGRDTGAGGRGERNIATGLGEHVLAGRLGEELQQLQRSFLVR